MWLFPPQPTYKLLITWLHLFFGDGDFAAILRPFLTRHASPIYAETKCARYLGASDV